MCVRRSVDTLIQTYRDMSPPRVAMFNRIKRSFNQMAVVSLFFLYIYIYIISHSQVSL